jgi:hypothetical protein
MAGVPRVWEKISEKMRAIGASIEGLKKKISTWAKAKGLEHAMACQVGGDGSYPCMYGLADKLVLSKVKENLGLDACKFGFTGAAPIMTETLECKNLRHSSSQASDKFLTWFLLLNRLRATWHPDQRGVWYVPESIRSCTHRS